MNRTNDESESKDFIDYNESTFLPFVNKAIIRNIKKARLALENTLESESAFTEMSMSEYEIMELNQAYLMPEIRESKIVYSTKFSMEINDIDLAEAVQSLPWKMRDVILLTFFTELTDEGIASVLKITRKTVINRRKKALGELKKILQGKGRENNP